MAYNGRTMCCNEEPRQGVIAQNQKYSCFQAKTGLICNGCHKPVVTVEKSFRSGVAPHLITIDHTQIYNDLEDETPRLKFQIMCSKYMPFPKVRLFLPKKKYHIPTPEERRAAEKKVIEKWGENTHTHTYRVKQHNRSLIFYPLNGKTLFCGPGGVRDWSYTGASMFFQGIDGDFLTDAFFKYLEFIELCIHARDRFTGGKFHLSDRILSKDPQHFLQCWASIVNLGSNKQYITPGPNLFGALRIPAVVNLIPGQNWCGGVGRPPLEKPVREALENEPSGLKLFRVITGGGGRQLFKMFTEGRCDINTVKVYTALFGVDRAAKLIGLEEAGVRGKDIFPMHAFNEETGLAKNIKRLKAFTKLYGKRRLFNHLMETPESLNTKMMLLSDSENLYRQVKQQLPGYELPRQSSLREVHDRISGDFNKLRHQNRTIEATSHERKLVGEYGEYLFHLPEDTHTLVDVGSSMNTCVGGYGNRAVLKDTHIVLVCDNHGSYAACLELDGEYKFKLVQAKAISNTMPDGALKKAIIEWADDNEVAWKDCIDLNGKGYAPLHYHQNVAPAVAHRDPAGEPGADFFQEFDRVVGDDDVPF